MGRPVWLAVLTLSAYKIPQVNVLLVVGWLDSSKPPTNPRNLTLSLSEFKHVYPLYYESSHLLLYT